MINKIMSARLQQVIEFKTDLSGKIELLQTRLSELQDEEQLLTQLCKLYDRDTPDINGNVDKISEEVLDTIPNTMIVPKELRNIPELSQILVNIENRKREKKEREIRKEVESKLRKAIEPEIREQLKAEYSEMIKNKNDAIAYAKEHLQQYVESGEVAVSTEAVVGINTPEYEFIRENGQVDRSKVANIVKDFLRSNGKSTKKDITRHIKTNYDYLDSVWNVKVGISNILYTDKEIKGERVNGSKQNVYFVEQ